MAPKKPKNPALDILGIDKGLNTEDKQIEARDSFKEHSREVTGFLQITGRRDSALIKLNKRKVIDSLILLYDAQIAA